MNTISLKMPSRYDVLQGDDSSEGSDEADNNRTIGKNYSRNDNVDVPNYEDLSLCRADEETVLRAVYDSDFSKVDDMSVCPRLNVNIKPPDLNHEHIGSRLT